ncbi:MAG: cupin domain-containing protein [Candidatus Heimdallarchaeota archaeon]
MSPLNQPPYAKYSFLEHTGYLITPKISQKLIAVGHTSSVPPWMDPELHFHAHSEEYYLLLQGHLNLLVDQELIELRANEILMVKPGIPHAIIGGQGAIEHFGIRAPALEDKNPSGEVPRKRPQTVKDQSREIICNWGYRIPLDSPVNQNCWLLGAGTARFQSNYLSLAYINFPTSKAANAGIGTRHQLHLHQKSIEYYIILEGTLTLQVEDRYVVIKKGEVIEVSQSTCHTLHSRIAPYRAFTLRVPIELSDKELCI